MSAASEWERQRIPLEALPEPAFILPPGAYVLLGGFVLAMYLPVFQLGAIL